MADPTTDSTKNPEPSDPELFIGLVGAVGTDLDQVSEALLAALREVNYISDHPPIRLSELFHAVPGLGLPATATEFARTTPADERYDRYMTAGNQLRRGVRRGDAAAMLGVGAIRELRRLALGDENAVQPRHAYVIRSLKHIDEVETLRRLYRSSFVLLGAYSRRDQRVQTFARMIADSRYAFSSADYRDAAERLVQRDEKESDQFGQNVRDTYPLADAFVDADDQPGLARSISRFIRVVFGEPNFTPSTVEQGIFFAEAASRRSSSRSRQVGAAITGEKGEVLAVGVNEVPKAGGGLYWEGDIPDGRDIAWDYDISDQFKRNLLGDVFQRLKKGDWLAQPFANQDVETLIEKAIGAQEEAPPLRTARMMDIIEFGRTVHAEMAALMDAARCGIPVADACLYTTTFPCHQCARHIVAAGIRRVIYVEPYAKSLAVELYPDSVAVEAPAEATQIPFLPFIGIAPHRYAEWFERRGKRKTAGGRAVEWNPVSAVPSNTADPKAYLEREQLELREFKKAIQRAELSWS